MNKLFRHTAAGLSAAVLAVSFSASCLTSWAEDSADPNTLTTVSLVLGEDDNYFFAKDTPGEYETLTIDTTQTNLFYMPKGYVTKEGYIFYGWTFDGIRGYSSNSVVQFDKSIRNIEIKPVLVSTEYDERVNVSFDFGKEIQLPKDFPEPYTAKIGTFISPYKFKIEDGNAFTSTYTFDGNTYSGEDYLIVPDHDVTFEAVWRHNINLTFYAGDVDRLTGGDTFVTTGAEGTSTELSAADRFGRIGYDITGWTSDYDGETYLPGQTVSNLPGVDITYTAVWSPKKYNVVFNQGTGKVADNIKVPGYTDTTIVCPEPTVSKEGKYFAGWKNASTGDIYQPGDEYFIYGVAPGLGIAFTPVWSDTPVDTTSKKPVFGDADLSGDITVSDIVTILQYAANKEKYPMDAEALRNSDVNFDTVVDAKDAGIVQLIEAGILGNTEEDLIQPSGN
ncbi:MAG: dockerin type I repeat-containing protein [Ruminococcus sp.]|nr:dockerin type I repeat-containing protein [Ruminococcus sp.]